VLCLAGAVAHLAVIAVQAQLHRMPPGALAVRLPMDVVLLTAPLVRRWAGSERLAAMLVCSAAAVAVPAIALQSGGLAAPMIVIVPLIPLMMAKFLGRGSTLFLGAMLAGGLVVVFALGRTQQDVPRPDAALEIRFAVLVACLGFAVLAAYLHERERAGMEVGLQQLAARLQEESIRDGLTKVYNRRYLDERLPIEMAFASRQRTELAVIMLDVDNFKTINDLHGHSAGDEVLTSLAARMRSCLRAEDMIARFGGEEFTVVLRTTDLAGAHVAAERLRRLIAASPIRLPGSTVPIPITISAGCASLAETRAAGPAPLLAAADRRMYAAKQAGRNRVVSGDGRIPDEETLAALARKLAT
jgi:diguanylate cyclase (GGDEF)-like protein